MVPRRIIVVSPDKAFGKKLAVVLAAAGGAVELCMTLAEIGADPALLVVHLEGDISSAALIERIGQLTGETRVLAIVPRTDLVAMVDMLRADERVAGLLVAEPFDRTKLAAMATRVLAGDIFGLDKVMPWGVQIHSCLVGDYNEKALCIAQVSDLAEQLTVRRKYRESIEQCLDELLMNALYDAPVDDEGNQIFAEIPTKTRIALRVDQKVIVQFACDGARFAISVRDAFGTLERNTVLRYLHKCLHEEQQIDRKTGGAGLGLYLIASSATDMLFNVLPGVATEAICTFDLEAPKVALTGFGFFREKIDAAGRLAAGPSKRLPSGASHPVERRAPTPTSPKAVIAVLVIAILATVAMIAIVAMRS